MDDIAQIVVIDSDDVSCAALKAVLENHDAYRGKIAVCNPEGIKSLDNLDSAIILGEISDEPEFQHIVRLAKPVRVGAVFDSIEKVLKKRGSKANKKEIILGPWRLDVAHSTLYQHADQKKSVRLTEKENELLQLLYKHSGQSVSREDMLKAIWGYVDGVETHTLETHIYRLRQKIEEDPAEPKILLTSNTGYILGNR